MSHSPLLGNRISLISKKNIRYEGTLYSINEADATVALADVRSYGTEGREKVEPISAYVPPQDSIHPYLLFRGCDIKDLHVHERVQENSSPQQPPSDPAIVSTKAPPGIDEVKKDLETVEPKESKEKIEKEEIPSNKDEEEKREKEPTANAESTHQKKPKGYQFYNSKRPNGTVPRQSSQVHPQQRYNNSRSSYNANRRSRKKDNQIGTGASLLHRRERGAVEGSDSLNPLKSGDDFDFESSAAEFQSKSTNESPDRAISGTSYTKDNFFDSISCDALDKQSGIDNRLRGAAERSLNTETFGAVSLGNSGRRGGRRSRRGRGGKSSSNSWRKYNN